MKKQIILTFFLLKVLIISAQTVIYPYRVEPSKFPDYNRRTFLAPAPTESFQDTVRFIGERYVKPARTNLFYGDFYRPNQGWIHNKSYSDFSTDIFTMIKEKVGVFDPGGYGPGTPYRGSFGQKAIANDKMELLNKLGPLFIGNSLGEQDGRYWTYKKVMEPYSRNPKVQHSAFLDFMRQNAKDYGYKLVQLTVFWGNHYMPKDGYVSAVGSECHNKNRVAQMQVQHAFNRGVSRQYGLINFGDVSVFNTWGWKGKKSDLYSGSSFAMMRRMMVLQYQYNSWILGFESGWGTVANPMPIGKIQIGMYSLVNSQLPQPGTIHSPVAFLIDFFSGWMPPYHDTYLKWGHLPYDRGQFLTHHLFDLAYPNYKNNGQNKDETPALVPNEHGDVDALLSDIHKELLLQYPMVVLADELFTDLNEVKAKMEYYVREGGHLVLTAVNAKKLFPANSFSDYETIASGASFNYKAETITEPNEFNLCTTTLADAKIIATANGKPAVIEISKGKGKYTIFLSDYGLNTTADQPNILQQTRRVLGDKMDELMLFTGGNQVSCTTNTLNDSTFIVGIYNNSLTEQVLNIKSKIGAVKSMTELPLGEDLTQEQGYKPIEGMVTFGVNSATSIRALDVRLFKIVIQHPTTKTLTEVTYPTLPSKKYLAIDNLNQVKNTISGLPHFFDHFTGIKVSWNVLADTENKAFKENVVWMNHQKLGLVLDFCETFPLTDFQSKKGQLYNSLKQELANIKTNLELFSGQKTIVLPKAANKSESKALTELRSICQTMGSELLTKSTKSSNGNAVAYDGTDKSIQSASLIYIEPTDAAVDMNSLSTVYSQMPIVYNTIFSNWDSTYTCIDAINKGKKVLIEKAPKLPIDKNFAVKDANVYKYISLHDNLNLKTEILKHQDDFFAYFGGVKVDGSYLWNISEAACKEEGHWLKTHKVKVIVDLIRELNHYPNLTWVKELESYERGKAIMDNILLKMVLMGSKDVIIGSHMRCEGWSNTSCTNENSIKAGMKVFIDAAIAKGITVHIQHREFRNYPNKLIASPAKTNTLVNEFTGTLFAANLGIVSDPITLTGIAGSNLGLVILAYQGDAELDCRNPLYKGMYNKSKPDYSSVSELKIPMILDAEYSNWAEMIQDCKVIAWKKTNL